MSAKQDWNEPSARITLWCDADICSSFSHCCVPQIVRVICLRYYVPSEWTAAGSLLRGLAVDTASQVEKVEMSLRKRTPGPDDVVLWTSQGNHLSWKNQPRTSLHKSQLESFHLHLFREGWKSFCRQLWQGMSLFLEYFHCIQVK